MPVPARTVTDAEKEHGKKILERYALCHSCGDYNAIITPTANEIRKKEDGRSFTLTFRCGTLNCRTFLSLNAKKLPQKFLEICSGCRKNDFVYWILPDQGSNKNLDAVVTCITHDCPEKVLIQCKVDVAYD